jgi:hypothetical protein
VPTTISEPTQVIGPGAGDGAGGYRTVPFRDSILYPMARMRGFEPERDLPIGEARAMCDEINSRVRFAWNFYPFAELELSEERAFRQTYTDVLDYEGGVDEVYFVTDQTYYRALEDTDPGDSPESAPDKWEAITVLDRYIAYNQFGRRAIGRLIRVGDRDDRLYRDDGIVNYDMTPSGYGIDLSQYATGPTVWITYIPRQPEFTATAYDEDTTYLQDALAYDNDTGEVYRALRDSTGEVPETAGTYWLRQEMPYLMSEYVKTGEMEHLRQAIDSELTQGRRNFYGRPPGLPINQTSGWDSRLAVIVPVPVEV